MLPAPIRHWLSKLSDQDYHQLKTMFQRIGYSGTWEQFLTEIYEEEQSANRFVPPTDQ